MSNQAKNNDGQVGVLNHEAIKDFAASEVFERTFNDGMAMVEEAAAYLDGDGRKDAKGLPRAVALAYAGESMRLTTRLMQVASWLLVQRAIRQGEMTCQEAADKKYRLGGKEICRGRKLEAFTELPEGLLALLERSEALYNRVDRIDRRLFATEAAAPSVVQDQMGLLQSAFGELALDA